MSLRTAIRGELSALGDVAPFDVHAHTGADVDGTTRGSEEHLGDLEAVGGRSVVFPLHVTTGYEAENRRVLAECALAPERLTPFARLDPKIEDVGAAAADALAAGAMGFKLHPRSEGFRLDHPGVDAIASVAAATRAPVLIHAGLGVGSFGPTITALAERHRECPIVLAHAAISDLSWLWEEVPAHPNLFFDTSWWNPGDLIALFSLVPPGRILFGSDAPYMDFELILAITLRCARFAGLSPEAIGLVAGGQLENLLAGGLRSTPARRRGRHRPHPRRWRAGSSRRSSPPARPSSAVATRRRCWRWRGSRWATAHASASPGRSSPACSKKVSKSPRKPPGPWRWR